MEVLILILMVVAIAEIALSGRWVPFYFLKGIILFKKSFCFAETPDVSPDDLTTRFSRGVVTPIVFYPLDEDLIAFREKMLSFRLFNYTPVMHGLIRVDRERREVSVTGYANWFALLFAFIFPAVFLANSPGKTVFFFVIPFLLFLFGSLYAIQCFRFTKILETIKQNPFLPLQPSTQHKSLLTKKINPTVLAVIIAILAVVWLIPTLLATFDRDLFLRLATTGKTAKLAPASQNGKFIYEQKGTIRFSAEPQYPVYIFIRKETDDETSPEPEQTVIISEGNQYTIQADLAPGDYEIKSALDPKDDCCNNEEKYWGAFGGRIHIHKDGNAEIEEQEIIHYLKMRILSPLGKNPVTEKRPTLRWDPVPGADHYKVDWRCDKNDFGHARTTSPEFTFGKDIEPAAVYHWDVEAINHSGEKIAYYSEPSFKTAGK